MLRAGGQRPGRALRRRRPGLRHVERDDRVSTTVASVRPRSRTSRRRSHAPLQAGSTTPPRWRARCTSAPWAKATLVAAAWCVRIGARRIAPRASATATRYFRIAAASLNDFDEMYRRYTVAGSHGVLRWRVSSTRPKLRSTALTARPISRSSGPTGTSPKRRSPPRGGCAGRRPASGRRGSRPHTANGLSRWTPCDAVRYCGDGSAALLAVAAAARVDGSLSPILADGARACADRDAPGLLAAGTRFEELGATFFGVDSWYPPRMRSVATTTAPTPPARSCAVHASTTSARTSHSRGCRVVLRPRR